MDVRGKWATKDAAFKSNWQSIFSRIQQGEKVDVTDVWSEISFPRLSGITGYLPGSGKFLLGVLPFYDFLYVPISFKIGTHTDFKRLYGIDTHYFLELVDAGKVIPVFPATSDLYSPYVGKEIWGYLEVKQLRHLLAWQLHALAVAFQSVSGIMLPWDDTSKDPWWTEMLINASALGGRLIADFPTDPVRFVKSRIDFEKLPSEVNSIRGIFDAEKMDFIAKALSLSFSNRISPSQYVEILNSKSTETLRRLFENSTKLEEVDGKTILSLCKGYNSQIENLSKSKGYKLSKLTSDLFTKHILAISLGMVAGSVAGSLPGVAGLIVGEAAQKLAAASESKAGKLIKSGSRTLTRILAGWLGKDSNLIHLCSIREALSKL